MDTTVPPPPRAPAPVACPNCGTRVDDRFCPHCGQRNVVRLVSVRRMLGEVLDDQLALNAALPRTLGALFARPGLLTREFVRGRVARYLAPFRLYLLASLVFFVALSWVMDPEVIIRGAEPSMRQWQAQHPGQRPEIVNLQIDTTRSSPLARTVLRRILRQQDRVNALSLRESTRLLLGSALTNAPRAAFLLVPVLALLLKLLYLRQRRLYVEHFVFAMHVQAFAFLLATAAMLRLVPFSFGRRLLALWVLVYLVLALKRVYGQGWIVTTAKGAVVVVAYLAVVGATVSALTVLSMFAV